MNYRHKRPRGKHTRENSSDWRYPQIEKGRNKRSKYSVARWVERAMESYREWRQWV